MTVAETIDAIFANDLACLRLAFERFATSGAPEWTSTNEHTRLALALEVCVALTDDVSPMPQALCQFIGTSPGTTYARGADKIASAINLER